MDLKEIKNLINFVSKSKISELNLKIGNIEVYIKKNFEKNTIKNYNNNTSYNKFSELEKNKTAYNKSNFILIKSPMIGTFYRRPSPDKDPYIKIGDKIKPGVKLCIIEAMKLFNDIESEVTGKIVKILVEDTSPVEYDQPLFLVDPT